MAKSGIRSRPAIENLAIMNWDDTRGGQQNAEWSDAFAQQHGMEKFGLDRTPGRLYPCPRRLIQASCFSVHARGCGILTKPPPASRSTKKNLRGNIVAPLLNLAR